MKRSRFVDEAACGRLPVKELCRLYGVSRKTGYKWIKRAREEGELGFGDRSHVPRSCPHAISTEVASAIVGVRAAHPTWGPRKLLRRLRDDGCQLQLPAASTAGRLLRELGLALPRRRRHSRATPYLGNLTDFTEPNAAWCADFKGQFEMKSGGPCYPLTVTDGYSRYLLCCEGFERISEEASRRAFERCFREHGLPTAIRTDNGVPFSTPTLSGLSKLAVWWIRLGIRPERIERGKPYQNGRHERMHRTLQEDVANRPETTLSSQQRALDAFRRTYNQERPHEALEDRTPASVYRPSPRAFPGRLPEPVYPDRFFIRRVGDTGNLNWLGERIYLSNCLAGELVGLEERPSGLWAVHFGPLELGLVDYQGTFVGSKQCRRSQRRCGSGVLR